jgi:hypothetical protein
VYFIRIYMSELVKVPVLKAEGVTLPVVSVSNYAGSVLCDGSLSGNASLLCVVAQEALDLWAGIDKGDHLIIAVGLDPEIGEYAATIFGGCPVVGAIAEDDDSLALDVGNPRMVPFKKNGSYVGCVVALIRKF